MRSFKTKLWMSFAFMLFNFSAFAQAKLQEITVRGYLYNNANSPLSDIPIYSVQAGNHTTTSEDGSFSIHCFADDYLVFDHTGYEKKVIKVENGTLASDTIFVNSLGSLNISRKIPVSYGELSFERMTGAVVSISGDELKDVPTAFAAEALAGRLAGLRVIQGDRDPLSENYNLSLRGSGISDIRIDGVPGQFIQTADEIDHITVDKDLSGTSLFGGTGSSGALFVTTKKGIPGEQSIRVSLSTGIRQPTFKPDMMNAVEFATAYNQALMNDGMQPIYSQKALDAYKNHSDPVQYPSIDYYDYFLKPSANYRQAGIDFSGGGKTVRYFSHLGYYGTGGLEKVGRSSNYNRFRATSKLLINIGDYGLLDLGIGGSFANSKYPLSGGNAMFGIMSSYPPGVLPLVLNDSTFGTRPDYSNNLLANIAHGSIAEDGLRDGFVRIGFNLDMGNLLKGLKFKSYVNITVRNTYSQRLDPSVNLAQPIFGYKTIDGIDTVLTRLYHIGGPDNSYSKNGDAITRDYYFYYGFNYDRKFGEDHAVTADVIFSRRTENGSDLLQDTRQQSFGGRVNYFYKNKYVLEGSLVNTGVQALYKDNRSGWFYNGGLGWIMSRESFLSDASWVDFLKLRASYGVSAVWFGSIGNDPNTYYLYENLYHQSGGVTFGVPGHTSGNDGYSRIFTGNPDIVLPRRAVLDIGADFQLFNKKINGQINYFRERYYDQILLPTNLYALLSANPGYMPYINYGDDTKMGWDAQVSYHRNIGKLAYTLSVNATYLTSHITRQNSLSYPESYRNPNGQQGDLIYGLTSAGLFQTQQEIDKADPQFFGSVQPGDIQYRDYNGDHRIDENDEHPIGHSPRLFYGLNLSVSYANWSFSLHGVGIGDGQIIDSKKWISDGRNYLSSMKNSWSTSNPHSNQPRLTALGSNNNYQNSTFWLKKAGYFNLKAAYLSYRIPGKVFGSSFIRSAKIYIGGKNLFILSALHDMYAPAASAGYNSYPVLNAYSIGADVSF